MDNINVYTVVVSILQRSALGEGADIVASRARREAERLNPGYAAVQSRFLGADAFDRYLGGRWVELEVSMVAA